MLNSHFSGSSKYKVLVADDEKSIRDFLRLYLTKKGFEVVEASTGRQDLEQFQLEKPHIVLLDIDMPELNGLETLRRLREISPESKIIMVTAMRGEEMFRKCTELGSIFYVVKPIELAFLDALISGKLLQ